MADYKNILSGTLGKLADKVRDAADSAGVLDMYAQGANRAKAFGQFTKLTASPDVFRKSARRSTSSRKTTA